ncbi:Multi antimicrobial extrusion protein like protein [Aduncisulcus paluster]|uniref:Multi antimicrobial extrusion protein like protein n=1 Tax=Aduncisulcus paluster TaxID=2918883 RepID=A0ABQ5KJR7_9EUKA|nr:Multi antimicrobial extrusion protein like protein [Aduncisulcus paluster]
MVVEVEVEQIELPVPETCYQRYKARKLAKAKIAADRHLMLASDHIFKTLMALSIPSIISMGLNAVYNVVDSIFLGNSSAEDLAAASLFMVIEFGVFTSLNVSLGAGASAVISPALGKGDFLTANKALTYFFTLLIIVNAAIPAIFIPYLDPLLDFLGATSVTKARAKQYALIMSAFPIGYGLTASMGPLLRVENKASLSMWRQVISSALNVIFDPILIFGFDLGTQGAAISTVASQLIVGVYMLWFYLFPEKSGATVKLAWNEAYGKGNMDWRMIGKMSVLGLGNLFSGMGRRIAGLLFNRTFKTMLDGSLVEVYQAIMGAMTQLSSLIGMPSAGIALGFIPLVGYNIGRNRYDRVQKALVYSFLSMLVIGGSLVILVEILARPISRAFGSDGDFLDLAPKYLRIGLCGVWLSAGTSLLMGYFQVRHNIIVSMIMGLLQPVLSIIYASILPYTSLGVAGAFWTPTAAFVTSFIIALPIMIVVLRQIDKKKHIPSFVIDGESESGENSMKSPEAVEMREARV